ncbi:hypothetical protein JMJ77_0014495 [Colletotrichum scovillei]|uniref:Uncharacterized protein n=1 Tax=Colletotrichum scovillei TaxID=1209932 RepID=A0A9P7UC27_9PEZI|nr:hypothetical protein JMJ77_0014495 [Colletotrichum scovillei]KAG7066029.1 hypothetical protein JMJ78_0012768 [Colletotrichum scovillei]KAG7068632.1 hypothetical protein JMJ76_0008314 [Colletotrichum scovillei]
MYPYFRNLPSHVDRLPFALNLHKLHTNRVSSNAFSSKSIHSVSSPPSLQAFSSCGGWLGNLTLVSGDGQFGVLVLKPSREFLTRL